VGPGWRQTNFSRHQYLTLTSQPMFLSRGATPGKKRIPDRGGKVVSGTIFRRFSTLRVLHSSSCGELRAFENLFYIYTRRYGALGAPFSSSCGELCNAAFGCKLGTFSPNCCCFYKQYTQTNGDQT
jgi:hypothetical protein